MAATNTTLSRPRVKRKDPPPVIEFEVDHEADPVDFGRFLDSVCALVEALPDDVASLAVA